MRARALGLSLLLSLACAREGATPGAYDASARESLRIPGGKRCLRLLSELGVEHVALKARSRMQTPVRVTGAIGGVTYTQGGKPALVCDCRLALALHWAAPVLRSWHITKVEHFGAYADRTTRRGRPSLHALGLAIDAARFEFPDQSVSVIRSYGHGWGDGCSSDAPALNRIVCGLRNLRLFRELITPDHDADHRDHVHLAIVPL
jgi:hypothetical protein